ncbi:hypothetical protein Tco_0676757 [Tanacetum coccineum]
MASHASSPLNSLRFPSAAKLRSIRVQIFYDRIDHTLKRTVDYATKGQLRKVSTEKAWTTIEELARYADKGWNDCVFAEGNLKNSNMEYDPEHVGLTFRLGGELRSMSLLEFGWRVGLYSYSQAGENITSTGLRKALTVKVDVLSVNPRAYTFKKKSLITTGIMMELDGGRCYQPATRQVREDDKVKEVGDEGADGSSDAYKH